LTDGRAPNRRLDAALRAAAGDADEFEQARAFSPGLKTACRRKTILK
jgi:hypothetical protein